MLNLFEQVIYATVKNGGEIPDDYKFVPNNVKKKEILSDRNAIWLCGEIENVSDGKITIQVNLKSEQMKGYNIFKNNTVPLASNDDIMPETKRLKIVKKWIEEDKGKFKRTFSLLPKTSIVLNGKNIKLSNLKKGNKVGILYDCTKDGKKIIEALQIRANDL